MQGHAAANLVPVIAANRVGDEKILPDWENSFQKSELKFYGHSFMTDETGGIKESAEQEETILVSEYDLDEINDFRLSWGVFRDRRPEMYKKLVE